MAALAREARAALARAKALSAEEARKAREAAIARALSASLLLRRRARQQESKINPVDLFKKKFNDKYGSNAHVFAGQ